ncbi:MAG: VWA domain-containing protein [Holophagales bacterium]|nr:VWA domain-containing protein [Holophagales bacterium]MXX60849.1 VWA domain-containing protein [Holophagales bacterium]MYC10270.1 VWA domain-containing protein [Holophagales bacterium]MYD22451.1 VWA domain-containing protein [Holophagales bacterium]MYI34085.1 VWA domain-containing protein [Holophagales bacterium]
MAPTRRCGRLTAAFLTLPLAAVPAGAQPPEGPDVPAATVAEQVDVNIVNIDVHVTNRRGRPIADLTAADFEVYENGELVEVTNFLNAAAREELEWTDGGELEADTDAPLMVALYVDRYRTRHGHLLRIEDDLASFLSARRDQGGGIRFLLATGDPELNVRVPFTDDPRELLGALEQLREEPRSGLHDDDLLRRRTLDEIRTTYETCIQPPSSDFNPGCVPCVDTWPALLGAAGQYAAEMQARAGTSLASLAELATALGGLPGPKALVYVSDGLPQRPGADLFHYLGQICVDRQSEADALDREWDDTTRFNRFSSFSNANRVTIYPVDAGGVRASSATDPTLAGPVSEVGDFGGTRDSRLSTVLVPSTENDRLRVDNLQATLSLLADETGGRAVFNQPNPAEALEGIASDFGSYYSLGYRAPPDRRHPIRQVEVRLTRQAKGWQVRYRRSYILKSADQRLADRLFAALKLDEQTNPLAADVTFGETSPGTEAGRRTLPVGVRVPVSAVTLLPGPSGASGAVRIFLVAEGEDGRRTPMRQKTLTLMEAELPEIGQTKTVVVNVDLPPGRFSVAVGVRDEASGRGSYLVRDVELPAG